MKIGGLGARAAFKQKPTKPCERCGLRHPIDEVRCSHCKDISDQELPTFKENIGTQHELGAKLCSIFFVVALALGVFLFLLSF